MRFSIDLLLFFDIACNSQISINFLSNAHINVLLQKRISPNPEMP